MGGRRGVPVFQMPAVRRVMSSASLPGGEPAIRGACSGQSCTGTDGCSQSGAPSSQRLRSRFPELSRGVWHMPHMATPSTRYFPRATRVGLGFLADLSGLGCWALVPTETATSSNRQAALRTAGQPRAAVPTCTEVVDLAGFISDFYFVMTPQAMRSPELPEGSVL